MSCFQPISVPSERVVSALIAGLRIEFGDDAGEALARRFMAAEEMDFAWDARVEERWVSQFLGDEDDGIELDRVRILACLDGQWLVATMIVDGEGRPHAMLARRSFDGREDALVAFADG
ncbi:hypothetical protein FPZ54_03695 [Sphingomonas suaedae]|uniref:Uncharacterized protein n=1 Tax=Sphingomonas suaedae TaxID=2599297 RepID=A0A518RCL2_9SPHN|nr:hypothetical protein [Sphingomonas suaedae]QDX25216.1 hypothetical protein FPZ54_03695 [Sphingomonas suaedae]